VEVVVVLVLLVDLLATLVLGIDLPPQVQHCLRPPLLHLEKTVLPLGLPAAALLQKRPPTEFPWVEVKKLA